MRAVALLPLIVGCVHRLPPTMEPAETLPYTTDDGWTAGVRHYPGDGAPVLLVHGMGVNHTNWDYREEVSLAAYLQERGWDVWVPDLRGDPGTTAPSRKAWRSYSVDDHAVHDLPAVIDVVLGATGEEQLYWVGHSMGGILLYMTLSLDPSPVAAGVAVCSPAEFDHVPRLHHRLSRAGWLVKGHGRLPARAIARTTEWLGAGNPLIHRVGNPDNLDLPVVHGIAKHGLVNLPRTMAWQATAWLKAGELVTMDGQPWLGEQVADTPLLVMGGARDRIAPWYGAERACDHFSDCRFVYLGVAEGFSSDMGHVDPVVGKTARTEVYPLIEAFLREHAPVDAAAVP